MSSLPNHVASGAERLISAVVDVDRARLRSVPGDGDRERVLWTIPAGSRRGEHGAGLGLGGRRGPWCGAGDTVPGAPVREFGWVVLGCLLAWAGVCGRRQVVRKRAGRPARSARPGALSQTAMPCGRGVRLPVILLPGLMVLAPGYASYLGLGSLARPVGVEAGFLAEFKVFVTIAWIIGGLFIANTIIPPTRALRPLPTS